MSGGKSQMSPSSALKDGQLAQSASASQGFDVLLVDPDEYRCLHLARELSSDGPPVRVAERLSGREALGGTR